MMSNRNDTIRTTTERLIEGRVVAVLRAPDPDTATWAAQTLAAAGVHGLEVTLTVPGAFDVIRTLASELGSDHLVGAGSVRTPDDARAACDAGAKYIVSPVFKPDVIAAAHDCGAAAMPGCFTPTEIDAAHSAGADIIKVFPAGELGMGFFKAVLAPMPHLKLMPTGGVSLDNGGEWLAAGAVAVGVGSALLDKDVLARRDANELTVRAHRLLASVGIAPPA